MLFHQIGIQFGEDGGEFVAYKRAPAALAFSSGFTAGDSAVTAVLFPAVTLEPQAFCGKEDVDR
jgi:hypothetical protein